MDPSTQNQNQPIPPVNQPAGVAAPSFPMAGGNPAVPPPSAAQQVPTPAAPPAPPVAGAAPGVNAGPNPYQMNPFQTDPGTAPEQNPFQAPLVNPATRAQASGGQGVAAPIVSNSPKQAARINPNSTQNTLQIAEIRDGIVIMSDGSFRSVVMVKSINFDLMSMQEKEAVEAGYQGFLNSLYFPMQIFIRSQKVDLQPYIDKLDKIRTEHDNMLLALLMEDYIQFMGSLSSQTNIMDKKFYVVIPYFPVADVQKAITSSKNFFTGLGELFSKKERHVVINEAVLEQAKAELRNRVQSVLGGLTQCGVQGLPLDTQELIELYYDTYNPDTATRQQLKNFNDLNAPVVTKGQGVAQQPNLDRSLG